MSARYYRVTYRYGSRNASVVLQAADAAAARASSRFRGIEVLAVSRCRPDGKPGR